MKTGTKRYLGDGLYAEYDGYQITLSAPREEGEHFVALDSDVLGAFIRFVEISMGLKIDIKSARAEDDNAE
jgi:hypothetical protein